MKTAKDSPSETAKATEERLRKKTGAASAEAEKPVPERWDEMDKTDAVRDKARR